MNLHFNILQEIRKRQDNNGTIVYFIEACFAIEKK